MSKYLLILAEKANHSIKALCRVLMVSTSAFYDWLAREPSERDRQDQIWRPTSGRSTRRAIAPTEAHGSTRSFGAKGSTSAESA